MLPKQLQVLQLPRISHLSSNCLLLVDGCIKKASHTRPQGSGRSRQRQALARDGPHERVQAAAGYPRNGPVLGRKQPQHAQQRAVNQVVEGGPLQRLRDCSVVPGTEGELGDQGDQSTFYSPFEGLRHQAFEAQLPAFRDVLQAVAPKRSLSLQMRQHGLWVCVDKQKDRLTEDLSNFCGDDKALGTHVPTHPSRRVEIRELQLQQQHSNMGSEEALL
jgi:hypothetical protein